MIVLNVEPGREEALGGAVEERRRRLGPARALRRLHLRVAVRLLDQVRVVARRRCHHLDGAGARVEHDGRAALAAEQALREPLGSRADRQHEVVALDGRALQPVADRVQDRAQVGVRAGEVAVLGALDAGPRAALRGVADHLRGEAVGRVGAEVERPPVLRLALDVPGEHGLPVGRIDLPAVDRELRHALDLVVLPGGEPACRPGLPVRRPDDQRGEQNERDDRDLGDALVHQLRDVIGRLRGGTPGEGPRATRSWRRSRSRRRRRRGA